MATKKQEQEPVVTTATTEEDIILTKPTSVWDTLSRINVSDHTEQKQTGGRTLTYLSWAWAWSEVKKVYPEAAAKVYENPEGWPYWTDGRSCWVKVSVTIADLEHVEYYPVMNARHNSIPADSVTSWDVNCAIQRGLTKCIARHGLGMYVYAGEDLPEVEANEAKEQRYGRAFDEVKAAKTRDEVVTIYHKYKEYHGDEAFVALCQQVTRELEQTPIINQ